MVHSLLSSPDQNRAILFVAKNEATPQATPLGLPAVLLPLHGRPTLQRAIERLVRWGCKDIAVVIGDHATEVKSFLGNGERWGCQLSYHYIAAQQTLVHLARSLKVIPTANYWLADAASIPAEALPVDDVPVATGHPLCWSDDSVRRWTGWGYFSGAWLLTQKTMLSHTLLENQVLSDERLATRDVSPPLVVTTARQFLACNRRLLGTIDSDAPTGGRGARIHRTARLIPPVYLGDRVTIESGAVIGPNVAIESGCVIDKNTHLSETCVMPDTYVGEQLDLHGVIACGGLLANTVLDTVAEITDPSLLAGLVQSGPAVSRQQRFLAGALQIGLLPLFGLIRWRTRHARHAPVTPVAIPRPRHDHGGPGWMQINFDLPDSRHSDAPACWTTHFCRTFFPALREVRRGNLQFIGPTLRSLQEVRALPPEWQRVYAGSCSGLLNEALLNGAGGCNTEEHFASDALSTNLQGGSAATLGFLRRYLTFVLQDLFNGAGQNPVATSPAPKIGAV